MTVRNRAAVKRRLVALAKFALRNATDGRGRPVTVEYAWPGDNSTDAFLFLGAPEGPSEPESIGANQKRLTRDQFTVRGWIQTYGHRDAETAEEAAMALLVAVEEYLSGGPKNLRHTDVPFDPQPDFDGIQSPYIANVDGPAHTFAQGDLVGGLITFDIACTTTIH